MAQDEQKYSFYDPVAGAFREVTRSNAEALIESAKKVEAQIEKEDNENDA